MKTENKLTPFGRYVVKTLVDRDMSKMELAAAVGISQPYLSYILYGQRSGKKILISYSCCIGN